MQVDDAFGFAGEHGQLGRQGIRRVESNAGRLFYPTPGLGQTAGQQGSKRQGAESHSALLQEMPSGIHLHSFCIGFPDHSLRVQFFPGHSLVFMRS